jgi:2-polyprenyl-3-methyl-5-hydroxy-6-metoxy-1,4-benzoquinol methylase
MLRWAQMRLLLNACLAIATLQIGSPVTAQSADSLRISNNRIYTSERHLFKVTPSAFLTQALTRRTPGTALDVGMGQGRNALWLAEHGWAVTGFDPSDVALAEAQDQARKQNVKIETVLSTYQQFDYGTEK